jgi:Lon protease-like protein
MMIELPLFPLSSVLFPGGTLPLHIFEERYKLMIGECVAQQLPFGVVLIRAGKEVGGAAEPYEVGTTARIARLQQLPDGRMNLIAVGVERFRIEQLTQRRPFLRARVEILQETELDPAPNQERAARVGGLFGVYYRLALALTDQWQDRVALPEDPRAVADFVAGRVDAEPPLKQRLLEELSVAERLRAEEALLHQAVETLAEQLAAVRRQRYAGLGALN